MKEASTLVVSCVDFRLRDEIADLLTNKLGLKDDYDEVALPGASLAFVESSKEHWGETITDIIGLLKDLHKIKRVIFVDHLGCGAYKVLKGNDILKTVEIEKASHLETFQTARKKLKQHFPDLDVHTFLMDLDGNVENIHE
ncbi:MAG: hypothetical protein EKK61_04490 [Rickettsiales bacterium]|nr:MAG: hypothetical protein EKK61_04490 [Rickettsiales bacterium]